MDISFISDYTFQCLNVLNDLSTLSLITKIECLSTKSDSVLSAIEPSFKLLKEANISVKLSSFTRTRFLIENWINPSLGFSNAMDIVRGYTDARLQSLIGAELRDVRTTKSGQDLPRLGPMMVFWQHMYLVKLYNIQAKFLLIMQQSSSSGYGFPAYAPFINDSLNVYGTIKELQEFEHRVRCRSIIWRFFYDNYGEDIASVLPGSSIEDKPCLKGSWYVIRKLINYFSRGGTLSNPYRGEDGGLLGLEDVFIEVSGGGACPGKRIITGVPESIPSNTRMCLVEIKDSVDLDLMSTIKFQDNFAGLVPLNKYIESIDFLVKSDLFTDPLLLFNSNIAAMAHLLNFWTSYPAWF